MSDASVIDSAEIPEVSTPEVKVAARQNRARFVIAGLAAAAMLAGGWYYASHRGRESTDDAQIEADIVSVPSRISGVLIKVNFAENQVVKAGDVLAEIDPEPARGRLAQAEANLAAATLSADSADADERVAETNVRSNKTAAQASLLGAQGGASATQKQIAEAEASEASATANLTKARLDLERAKALFASGSTTQVEVDRDQAAADMATAALDQAKARLASVRASTLQASSRVLEAGAKVEQVSDVDALILQARSRAQAIRAQVAVAKAARDLAALDFSYTKIVAPQSGVVSKKTAAVGQMISVGQGIVQLVPVTDLWVTGNFKETQVTAMRAGQPAHLAVDAFPGIDLEGEVESLSAATGARFTLLPPDNASGNFTKVVQRVPVRVKLHELPVGVALRPGMSVELTVDTRGSKGQ
jgi:membrane fusion protein (multidrug efflux system)